MNKKFLMFEENVSTLLFGAGVSCGQAKYTVSYILSGIIYYFHLLPFHLSPFPSLSGTQVLKPNHTKPVYALLPLTAPSGSFSCTLSRSLKLFSACFSSSIFLQFNCPGGCNGWIFWLCYSQLLRLSPHPVMLSPKKEPPHILVD